MTIKEPGDRAIGKIARAAERASYHLNTASHDIDEIKTQFGVAMFLFGPESPELQQSRGEYAQIYTLLKSICTEMEEHSRIDLVLFDMVQAQNRGSKNEAETKV